MKYLNLTQKAIKSIDLQNRYTVLNDDFVLFSKLSLKDSELTILNGDTTKVLEIFTCGFNQEVLKKRLKVGLELLNYVRANSLDLMSLDEDKTVKVNAVKIKRLGANYIMCFIDYECIAYIKLFI